MLVQGKREKMWRFVHILCIWNQYTNMQFMLRGVPSAGNKEKEEIIPYYGEIIFWLYYYGCGYFIKRRWVNNFLTNWKGKRKQNAFLFRGTNYYFSCNNKNLCKRAEKAREGQQKWDCLMVGERWELGHLPGSKRLQRKGREVSVDISKCAKWEKRSFGAWTHCKTSMRHQPCLYIPSAQLPPGVP